MAEGERSAHELLTTRAGAMRTHGCLYVEVLNDTGRAQLVCWRLFHPQEDPQPSCYSLCTKQIIAIGGNLNLEFGLARWEPFGFESLDFLRCLRVRDWTESGEGDVRRHPALGRTRNIARQTRLWCTPFLNDGRALLCSLKW